jgi:hypothetical protein
MQTWPDASCCPPRTIDLFGEKEFLACTAYRFARLEVAWMIELIFEARTLTKKNPREG